jgi:hypothetical protein
MEGDGMNVEVGTEVVVDFGESEGKDRGVVKGFRGDRVQVWFGSRGFVWCARSMLEGTALNLGKVGRCVVRKAGISDEAWERTVDEFAGGDDMIPGRPVALMVLTGGMA